MKQWNKKKKKRAALAAAAFILVLAAAYTAVFKPLLSREQWVYKGETVKRGTLTAGVTESGFLSYGTVSQIYDLNLTVEEEEGEEGETVSGYLVVEKVYAAPGQRIAEGEPLMKFTEESVEDVRRLLNAAFMEAEVAFGEAESAYGLSLLEAQFAAEAAQAQGEYAKSLYGYESRSVEDGLDGILLEIRELEARRESLQESLETAKEAYEQAKEAYETAKGDLESMGTGNEHVYIAYQGRYLGARSKYETAGQNLRQARENIESLEAQIEKLQREAAQTEARQAIERMEAKQEYENSLITAQNAEVEYTALQESLKEELEEAQESLAGVREQVEAFEAFVGTDGVVYAAGSGIVTEVGFGEGDALVSSGALLSYCPADAMTVTVDVSQEDIVSLAVGDEAEIVFSACGGENFKGIVSSIVTGNTSENSSTVSYPVTVEVLGDTGKLYGGMSADVTFVTEKKENVLYISRKAAVEKNGKTYVYVDAGQGGKVLREIGTGINNGVYMEVTEGLEEEETVYTAVRAGSGASGALTDTAKGGEDGAAASETGALPGQSGAQTQEAGTLFMDGMQGGVKEGGPQ